VIVGVAAVVLVVGGLLLARFLKRRNRERSLLET
jgi:glucose uptake protein GlcU